MYRVDLRKTFKRITKDWGLDVLLQRRIVDAQSGIYATADNGGFATTYERWTVRHEFRRETQLANSFVNEPEGLNVRVDILFYFPWNANPKEGDRILVKDNRFSTSTKQGYESYIVNYALSMLGRGGRVEFWVAGCMRERPR